ncbi:MAG: hypothetical protein WBC22_19525 [Sedimentisphaerales bacterium]
MKSLTYLLKITAIALNTYFSAWLLLFVCTGYGGHPLPALLGGQESSYLRANLKYEILNMKLSLLLSTFNQPETAIKFEEKLCF